MAAIESPSTIVVCDAGPLIHLDELACLPLLVDFSRVLIPPSVWDEVAKHRPTALTGGLPLERTAAGVPLATDLLEIARLLTLHTGELEALSLAREHEADFLLTDDTAARLAARMLSIPAHGTIGVLLRAIRRGQRTAAEVATTLRSLPRVSTLHVRPSLLDEIIRQVEQDT